MMAINFTKAIELQVVRKLKSHAKVGYQDHPNGDKRCSGCSMFVDGNPPACTHVAPPIQSHGYCDDYVPLDPNARARAALGKSGPEDEARDERGRWTSGSALSRTREQNMSLPQFGKMKTDLGNKFVNAVRGAAGDGLIVDSKWNKLSADTHRLEVNIRTKNGKGSAAAGMYLDRAGNLTLEQHDIGLADSLKGKGIGGRMVGAFAAGFKAVGAKEGDVHIHVNTK